MEVQELFEEYKTYDPFKIAEKLDIEIEYGPIKQQGLSLPVLGRPVILLQDSLKNTNKKYLVMAHELYHAMEHSELACFYSTAINGKGKLEREANQFSANLLFGLYTEFNDCNPTTFNDLKYYFGMPDDFIEFY